MKPRDWIWRTVAGMLLGAAIALASSALFMRLASGIAVSIRVQIAMWMTAPVWLLVWGAFYYRPRVTRSDVIRVYQVVHTWTGILAGMALFIGFYAGALTLFKDPIARWATPPAALESGTVALEDVPAILTKTLASHPESARELRVNLLEPRVEYEIRPKGVDEHDNLSVRHFRATVEGAEEVRRSHVGELIDVLHRVVGLPVDRDENRWFMGAVAALYALAIFSGIVILLPSLVRDLFALRIGPNLKRMWLDAHNVVGIFSLPFHVVMAVTAVIFAFHDGIYFVQDKAVHHGQLQAMFRAGGPTPDPRPRDPAKMLPPAELVARVKAIAPDFEPEALQYLGVMTPRATVRVWGRDPNGIAFRSLGGMALVDPYSGRITNTEYLPGRQSAGATVLASVFALHFASFGGPSIKWLYFVLAMLGAWLFYSGNLLWIESRRKKEKHQRNTRLMGSATLGVCLGAVCGISATLAAAKWLPGHVADPNAWHSGIYYAVFFGCLAWSFARGPARSAVDLLGLAIVTTLAIPLSTLCTWSNVPAVDVTAAVMALAFAWMLRPARHFMSAVPRIKPKAA